MLIFIAHNGKTLELDVEPSTRYSSRTYAVSQPSVLACLCCAAPVDCLTFPACGCCLLSVTWLVTGLSVHVACHLKTGLLFERNGLHCEGDLLAMCVMLSTIAALGRNIGLAHWLCFDLCIESSFC